MGMDFDGFIQLMEMMSPQPPSADSPEQRKRRMMLTMLKLIRTKGMMESYEAQHVKGDYVDRCLYILTALKPHMTGERRHMTEVLIKIFELKQLMGGASCR